MRARPANPNKKGKRYTTGRVLDRQARQEEVRVRLGGLAGAGRALEWLTDPVTAPKTWSLGSPARTAATAGHFQPCIGCTSARKGRLRQDKEIP